MRNYETLFICRQDISATQVEGLADKFQEVITNANGTMGRRENWGLKTLAYRIKKNRKGHMVLFNYSASHEAIVEMERRMTLSDDVIRYMTTQTEVLETEDSVAVKGSDERPSRGSR
jgi:small subunit ribosomal protein S6